MDFCEAKDWQTLLRIIQNMASASPISWSRVRSKMDPNLPNSPIQLPSWCICGQYRPMIDPKERVCCKNETFNHEHVDFSSLVLDHRTLRNNADWLNEPLRFTPADIEKQHIGNIYYGTGGIFDLEIAGLSHPVLFGKFETSIPSLMASIWVT